MTSPHRQATEILENIGWESGSAKAEVKVAAAQVLATLALAEAIQSLDVTFHDSLRAIAAVVGDVSEELSRK